VLVILVGGKILALTEAGKDNIGVLVPGLISPTCLIRFLFIN